MVAFNKYLLNWETMTVSVEAVAEGLGNGKILKDIFGLEPIGRIKPLERKRKESIENDLAFLS